MRIVGYAQLIWDSKQERVGLRNGLVFLKLQEAQSEPGVTQDLCLRDGLNRTPNLTICLINRPFQDSHITAVQSVGAYLLQT